MARLEAGSRIGHYQILAPIGAGGMGEVYRARDTRLGRDVALKVLPAEFASDEDRLSRFRREAKVLASLNHPRIGQIYGLEESGGMPCLVLELVEGETIQDRLRRGPVPFDEALGISLQIAEGLEAAHDRGIMHRDLKPANIKLTPDGKVKVLDFGLAKMFEAGVPGSGLSQSTTLSGMTAPNVLLGTLAYMSPEQLRGQPAGERSDIWAFGCVLYELLTGKRAFAGNSAADTMGAITKTDPDWPTLPSPAIQRLLRRCLQKDLNHRLRHIADARIEIEDALSGPPEETRNTVRRRFAPHWLAGAVIGLVLGAAVVLTVVYFRRAPGNGLKMSLEITAPGRSNLAMAISPDGRAVVYDANRKGPALWIRRLDSPVAEPLPGTDGGILPFWSPDSRSLAFFANGKLKRIEVAGGPAQDITDAINPRGGAWNSDRTIIFNAASSGPLSRVSVDGSLLGVATQLQQGQGSHRYPQFLPDGRHFLYFALGKPEVSGVYVGLLDSVQSWRIPLSSDSQAVYADPGYLLFLRQGILLAQRFDLKTLELSGDPLSLADHVAMNYTGSMIVSAADNGTVAYRVSVGNDSRLTWFDRLGKELKSLGPIGDWNSLDLSMDETRVVAQKAEKGNVDIWMLDVERGLPKRLTSDPADDESPTWSPDGKQIVFDSNRKGSFDLYQMAVQDIGKESPLEESSQTKIPTSWSFDGSLLLFAMTDEKTGSDLWARPFAGNGKRFPLANTGYGEFIGSFSTDMHWIVYESNETGRSEVYIQSFPELGNKRQISIEGGGDPRWRRDGREVFYIAPDGTLMATAVSSVSGEKQIRSGKSVPLFQTTLTIGGGKPHGYAVAAGGQRFLLPVPVRKDAPPITILLNWAER